ncbi:hypothetical protein RF11_13975 [Thelohanellus kitauei]|uniref:WAP domain-containing protein n=1 Tax=Thelohanellus kitauei TaxID=669202 RepID=A0A0C2MH66_THEKT|nr:hypothetical protein RF11_13975 [Thelohanellus kitauei]
MTLDLFFYIVLSIICPANPKPSECIGKRCIYPECDGTDSLSMCYKVGEPCPPKHESVSEDLICGAMNMQCCRSICDGSGTMCFLKTQNCPPGYGDTVGNWSCPLPEYRCCSKNPDTIEEDKTKS